MSGSLESVRGAEWPISSGIRIRSWSTCEKHGIDFSTAKLIWDGPAFERVDRRRDYGEVRFQAFGVAENRILTVIFTWRGQVRRIISARRSNFREKIPYQTEVGNPDEPAQD